VQAAPKLSIIWVWIRGFLANNQHYNLNILFLWQKYTDMAEKYGITWWGSQWLNSLSHIDYDNRLPRGRRYAGNGSVKSIEINGNTINAKVKGSQPKPYNITIEVPAFNASQKENLIQAIIQDNFILSKLLNRELPQELNDIALKKGIQIFPSKWKDFKMKCSCPDWAVPCKHLAAVIYLVANEIDKNPFLVFTLHNLDLIAELSKRNITQKENEFEKIFTVEDFIEKEESVRPDFHFDFDLYNSLDFSAIEDLKDKIANLLTPKPLFYSKDFKEILVKQYKTVSKSIDKYIIYKQKDFNFNPEELHQVTDIKIVFDNKLKCSNAEFYIYDENKNRKKEISADELIHLLQTFETKNLLSLSSSFIALHIVYQFAVNLIRNGAIIPQLIKNSENQYLIRWIPASNNNQVKDLSEKIIKLIDPGLGIIKSQQINKKKTAEKIDYLTVKENFNSIFNFFASTIINKLSFSDFDSQKEAVFTLFFQQELHSFNDFSTKQIPNTIQLWLSKFYLSHKAYIPIIVVNDKDSVFELEIKIENSKAQMEEPIAFSKFLKSKNHEKFKIDVLKDVSQLTEYLPEIKKYLNKNGEKPLIFSSDEFTPVILNVLPVIQLLGIRILLPRSLSYLFRPKISIKLKSKSKDKVRSFLGLGDLLDFDWQIAVGDELMDFAEFKKLVKNFKGLVKIRDKYVLINEDEINKIYRQIEKNEQLASETLLQSILSEDFNGSPIGISDEIREIVQQILKTESVKLPNNLNATLRPYQIKGYEWLVKNAKLGMGSIIADDMGLGKTLQVISALLKFKQEKLLDKKKAIVIVPTTLLTNWQKEIQKFAPGLNAHIYHGTKRKFEKEEFDLLLTTYGVVRSDFEKLQKIKWFAVIADEAQNIKNNETEQTKAVKKLKSDIKIAMSGTPVENRLSEYWSIFDFTNKGYLGGSKWFKENFAVPITENHNIHCLEKFKKITQPFILRRLKSDKSIISDLPEKIENTNYCTLSKEQAAIYQNVIAQLMPGIEETEDNFNRQGLVLKMITALKQVCNHPVQYLKKGKPEIENSGKTQLLINLLENIYENNEKTLIFTQYKEMGDLLCQIIENQFGYKPLFLHGGTTRKQRDKMVEDFQNIPQVHTFILSLKAGGTGLNLTAANHVVHYDLWWNPAVEAQATDRAYRIGQKNNVMVYRLLTQGTFEEKINQMLQVKKDLANLTVATGENWLGDLSNNELKELVNLEK
jgi:SNF2 family DNA or RNA helicase/uncharacterized Zn finger protein